MKRYAKEILTSTHLPAFSHLNQNPILELDLGTCNSVHPEPYLINDHLQSHIKTSVATF